MIIELTTYSLRPRCVPKVEEMFARAYDQRRGHSELTGSFHTEFGPLNQIIQIFQYASFAERDSVAAAVAAQGTWPPPICDCLVAIRTEIMKPTAISPELKPGKLGPYFELRTYTYPLGTLGKILSVWQRAMPARDALGSPVAAIWTTEIGTLNTLTHIWPYRSLEQREEIRKKVRASGKWPPYLLDIAEGGTGYEVQAQENKLMLPATFSPLQ